MPYTINNDATFTGESALLAGRYRIVGPLGHGRMGSVWLVEDTHLDNMPFAVKMLPSILVSNDRAYRQLKNEAIVAMRLVHPNIVTLRAFEENNGNPFLVMDYIDGKTLDDYLADYFSRVENVERVEVGDGRAGAPSGLPESEVLRLLKPIAAALDYAHSKGVVHRDVKPGNVMVAKDGTPYILDFSIAREMQETMTCVTGRFSGTLPYMSPEQLRGQPPKPAQDIYSFAAMAYECLNGEPPFARGQIERRIFEEQPEPLIGRVALNALIAAGIMSGLAKKPEDRPPSCSAVLGEEFLTRRRKGAESAEVGSRVPHDRDGDSHGHSGVQSPYAQNDIAASSRSPRGGVVGKTIAMLALVTVAAGGYYIWRKYDESVQARMAGEKRLNEALISKLKSKNDVTASVIKRQQRDGKLAENSEDVKEANAVAATPVANISQPSAKQEVSEKNSAELMRENDQRVSASTDIVDRSSVAVAGGSPNTKPQIQLSEALIKVPDASVATEIKGGKADKTVGTRREYRPYTGATKEYIVKGGDTLGGIALRYGLTVRQFKELNGLTNDKLRVGQKYKVPDKATAKPDNAKVNHATKDGDSIKDEDIFSVTGASFDEDSNYVRFTGVTLAPVYFDVDRTSLNQSELSKIEVVAAHLRQAGRVVIVEGHCDDRFPNEYALALGESRARIVGHYLVNCGIAPTKIQVRSCGEERPVAVGGDEKARSKNRRVEFVVFVHK